MAGCVINAMGGGVYYLIIYPFGWSNLTRGALSALLEVLIAFIMDIHSTMSTSNECDCTTRKGLRAPERPRPWG